jgi:hypothetical protein
VTGGKRIDGGIRQQIHLGNRNARRQSHFLHDIEKPAFVEIPDVWRHRLTAQDCADGILEHLDHTSLTGVLMIDGTNTVTVTTSTTSGGPNLDKLDIP